MLGGMQGCILYRCMHPLASPLRDALGYMHPLCIPWHPSPPAHSQCGVQPMTDRTACDDSCSILFLFWCGAEQGTRDDRTPEAWDPAHPCARPDPKGIQRDQCALKANQRRRGGARSPTKIEALLPARSVRQANSIMRARHTRATDPAQKSASLLGALCQQADHAAGQLGRSQDHRDAAEHRAASRVSLARLFGSPKQVSRLSCPSHATRFPA